jgi:polyhydroxybutyrate depolymerase
LWWVVAAALGILVALLCVLGWAYYIYAPAPAVPHLSAAAVRGDIRVGDRTRSYLAYIPARLPPRSPLVLVLHGSFMDAEMMRQGTGYEFDVMADRDGFAVVYPNGYDHNWNDCRRTDAYPAKSLNIDDMSFMRAIIARLRSERDIDPAGVFAMGYSDGAGGNSCRYGCRSQLAGLERLHLQKHWQNVAGDDRQRDR